MAGINKRCNQTSLRSCSIERLTFAPENGGETFTATWADPEQDGEPTVDDIKLVNGESYTVTMTVLNELEDPAEDLTA